MDYVFPTRVYEYSEAERMKYVRPTPAGRYDPATHASTTVEYGDVTFECLLITNKDRLLCPIERCKRRYETENGLISHLNSMHGYTGHVTKECPACGESFRVHQRSTVDHCSNACAQTNPENYV